MKTKIIDHKNITLSTITDILDAAAIEYSDNGGLYVTEYPFNFWLDVDQGRKLIILYTFWDTVEGIDELEILRFANHFNSDKLMVQFTYNEELGRFYGYYTHIYNGGLLAPNVLKICQRFSGIFEEVVDAGIAAELLMPLPQCPCDVAEGADDAADAAGVDSVADSTVH